MAVGIAVRVPVSVGVNLDTLSLYTAQAMYEIAEAVGCIDCKKTIEMGVVKKHIIEIGINIGSKKKMRKKKLKQ